MKTVTINGAVMNTVQGNQVAGTGMSISWHWLKYPANKIKADFVVTPKGSHSYTHSIGVFTIEGNVQPVSNVHLCSSKSAVAFDAKYPASESCTTPTATQPKQLTIDTVVGGPVLGCFNTGNHFTTKGVTWSSGMQKAFETKMTSAGGTGMSGAYMSHATSTAHTISAGMTGGATTDGDNMNLNLLSFTKIEERGSVLKVNNGMVIGRRFNEDQPFRQIIISGKKKKKSILIQPYSMY